MKVQTKWFGEIEVSDDKIITFDKGIIGFEDWKKYTLVYDAEKEENISCLLYTSPSPRDNASSRMPSSA